MSDRLVRWLHVSAGAALLGFLPACAVPRTPSPVHDQRLDNVLLIVADDISMERIGAFARTANSGPTPTIDQLAARGIRFSRAYSNPLCSPTRATLLTGLYGFRTGIGSNIEYDDATVELRESEFTLPEGLAQTHRTAVVGKWHLATLSGHGPQHPIVTGFLSFAGNLEQLGGLNSPPTAYFDWEKTVASADGNHQERLRVYSTSEHVDDAIGFIEESGAAPWFLYLAFNAPHTPFHVPPRELTTLVVDQSSSPPEKHRAMVEAMDTEIGRLLRAIPPAVLARTWVVFVGDNGSHGFAMSDPAFRNKAKSTVFESGVNVPLVIAGPGLVGGGREVDSLVNTTDLFMTVLDMAGVRLEQDVVPCDSISLMPYLTDPDQVPLRQTAYSELFVPNGPGPRSSTLCAVIGKRYKLVVVQPEGGLPIRVLFDLELDPDELAGLPLDDLSPEQAEQYISLASALQHLLGSVSATTQPD